MDKTDTFEDIKKFFNKVLKQWYLVVGILVLALLSAFLLNRYSSPIYVINASFITKKFDGDQSNRLMGLIEENIFRENIEVYQEIPLLKSQDKIEETLRRLDFQVSYFVKGWLKTQEIFPMTKYNFFIEIDSASTFLPTGIPIYINSSEDGTFTLSSEDENLQQYLIGRKFHFGIPADINGLQISIKQTQPISSGDKYYFVINSMSSLLAEYRNKLLITWAQKGSAILNLNIRSKVPEKDIVFVRTYLDVIIEKGLQDKNEYLTNTIEFINSYITGISDSMMNTQERIDYFKLTNREVVNGSSYVLNKLNELDDQKIDIMLSNQYLDYLTNYIKESKQSEVFAPNLIGLDAPLLDQLINQYVEVKWGDKINLNDANALNPLVSRQNEASFARIEKNIYESIRNYKLANEEKLRQINEKANFFYNSLRGFQGESREYNELQRMSYIYDNLSNDLISKRTSAHIARAGTVSDYQVITFPGYSSIPILPDTEKNFMYAFVLGLLLPIGYIYLRDLFSSRIITKDDLLKYTTIPLIGSVGHSTGKTNLVIKESPKSFVAESFRGLRANLQYLNKGIDNDHIVYLITSLISGEGKTFCSINLAYTFAMSGKKTILLGADMRKPTLGRNFTLPDYKGLSNYLAGFVPVEKIIKPTDQHNLYIIPGGDVPPNPAELITTPRMDELMEYLKEKYEIIIVDTPPIGLVSDTLELLKYAKASLLVVRQGRTFKDSLASLTEIYSDGRINNIGILFNDVDFSRFDYGRKYGYGYGYGYGNGYGYYEEDEEKKVWWKRIRRKVSSSS